MPGIARSSGARSVVRTIAGRLECGDADSAFVRFGLEVCQIGTGVDIVVDE
ncbi:hypothetical protein [Singulisphaera sp. PoT]|uniref:hypothetical protein n=1 Tax=Singulisphaera sp. PoT TaxID=3411797 RepID=UPI003BF61E6B